MPNPQIISIGLRTREDLQLLGPQIRRAYPVDPSPRFEDLLRAIDEADRAVVGDTDPVEPRPPEEADASFARIMISPRM